ncbi:flavodoxin domain-containing protein [Microlunatus phosphovorus]|nr:flavodoxin domain-containing protein [Microlunatus phosphovorus]
MAKSVSKKASAGKKSAATKKASGKKALVVYESMFGNTEKVAHAIGEGLSASLEVEVVEVSEAPVEPGPDVTLVVAGGPTHAFGMTREETRADAIELGAEHGAREFGLREWIDRLPARHGGPSLATFDTRSLGRRRMPGSAARAAARAARRHGYDEAAPAESFFVADTDGPLVPGELERATDWGRDLIALVKVTAKETRH